MTRDLFLEDVGDRYGDFVVTKVAAITELGSTLRELTHEPSGAQVMHIAADDPENLFSLSFKTLPDSSNGVAHILEHTVLCGSRRFPIKDPFFAMSRRSLNTYMNALTGSDFTCYPAASQVEKDFYNLLDVYIDAVFHPELKEVSFLQEGHRLEFADPKDPTSPLEYKGIVLNEMKGSLSSADSRLWYEMMAALFPNLPYGFNSGGDPKEIPKLTYEELIAFHETYYNPSRCLFFFYGNLPLKKHLDFIAEKALKNSRREPPLPPIPLQKRFDAPRTFEYQFPINEGESLENKTIIAFGWLTLPLLEQDDVLALCVLDSILMDTDASLLKLPLLKSGLCVHADAHIDVDMSEVPYLIVCKGGEKKNADELEKLLLSSLEKIAEDGIPPHLIDTAIHQLEFARTEISGDSSPFGLTLFMRSALAKQHGCPPENALKVHTHFEKLIRQSRDPKYFPSLIRKLLIDNPHRVRLVMSPDPGLASQELAQEKALLEEIKKSLTKSEVSSIVKQAENLTLYQKKMESQNIDLLPKVGLEDVPLLVTDFKLHEENFGDLRIFHHNCFTNQILYVDLVLDLPELSQEELPYLQLLVSLLSEIGAGPRDWRSNLEYIQSHTGGIGAVTSLHPQIEMPQVLKPSFTIRGKALYRKADKLFDLIKEIIVSPRLNEKERIQELILQLDTSMQNRFNRQALRYALQLALSSFSHASHLANSLYGLTYFKEVQHIAKLAQEKPDVIIDRLLAVKDKVFSHKSPHLILSCDEKMYRELQKEGFFGLAKLPLKPPAIWKSDFPLEPVASHARPISSPVAFTVQAFRSVHYIHPHSPAISCAMPLFENKIFHRKIREEGGAYGTGAAYSSSFGNFYFYAYRDPHLGQTLKVFSKSIETIASGSFDERDLEEAKLGVIQSMDMPIAPGSRAIAAYNNWRDGKTKERRQLYRDSLLSLNKKQIMQAVEKEILPQKDAGITISFAGRELLEKENLLPILPL
ncbi:MAG: insulinase family protein [Chlamydiales bacterium]|nr:insulinase family protein [Chlamydiales bacterium]